MTGAIVYGSVAQGQASEESDLDLVLVTAAGQREDLWQRRREVAEALHERAICWVQEPLWQRPFRYQTWDDRLLELDLTLDEAAAAPWHALTRGYLVLVDKTDVAERLAADLAAYERPEFDALRLDGGTRMWLGYLAGRLRRGETWLVRYGLMDTLNNRVVPLLGSAGHSACAELGPDLMARINAAAPSSAEPAELQRALQATAELYEWALAQWAERTGQPKPEMPLAPALLAKVSRAGR